MCVCKIFRKREGGVVRYSFSSSIQGGLADVVFTLENKEVVPVHRSIIVARSSTLRQMLQDIKIKSKRLIGPPALVKEVLKFLYCAMPPANLESIATKLLPVAHQYGVIDFRALCERALRRILTVENLVDILVLAEVNDCHGLITFCLPFYKANALRSRFR